MCLGEVVAGGVRGAADICADICLGCSLLKMCSMASLVMGRPVLERSKCL